MKLATVIVTADMGNNLKECVAGIKHGKFNGIENQIIIIDNSDDNRGFAGGNNWGIKKALKVGAEAILLLNDDASIEKSTIHLMKETLFSDQKTGVVVPKIYFYPGFEYHKDRYKKEDLGKVIWYAGGEIDRKNVMGIHFGVDEIDRGQYNKRKEVEFATGCAMMIKREVLEETGLFDERYFLYLEDMDLSIRIKKSGYKIIYEPKAIVWHKNAQSSGVGSGLHDYFFTRNRLLFGMKYATLRTKFALIRESGRILVNGNEWRRKGVIDFYLRNFGKGSYK